MKGTIPKCLEEMIRSRHGKASWDRVRAAAGLPAYFTYLTTEDVPDADVMALFDHAARELRLPLQRVMDDFGLHWSTRYAPDIYAVYFRRASSAKELLLAMTSIHRDTTARVAGARPPRFEYRWVDQDTLVMTYRSDRGLAALMPALIRGVGTYYGDLLDVRRDGDDMWIRFHETSRTSIPPPTR